MLTVEPGIYLPAPAASAEDLVLVTAELRVADDVHERNLLTVS